MKKLPENERLKRGIQVLLNDQDQADLRRMAAAQGLSLSSMLRVHVLSALNEWRSQQAATNTKETGCKR